jgi:PAS domain S-box-containing protein/putative nucleotidyltransferase with HDIG domain
MKIDTYRNLIDQIAAAVLILDDKGIIQYANQDTIDLLCCETEDQVLGSDFERFVSPDQIPYYQTFYQSILQGNKSQESVFSLVTQDESIINVALSGAGVQEDTGFVSQTIWTLKDISALNHDLEDQEQQNKLEDLRWLSEQGRELLSLNQRSDILDFAGRELQEKLGNCIVLTLSNVDLSTLRLEGIYGIEKNIMTKVWKMTEGDLRRNSFPIDERTIDALSKRQLFLHSGGLENFAETRLPKLVSRQIAKMVGIEDIYTIGLEGNQRVMGCFYIFTKRPQMIPSQDLVESFTFLVALALERTEYAGELILSEQQLQLIFEHAQDGYYFSDLQGNFLNGNRAAEKLTGYDREELIGKNFLSAGLLSKSQGPLAAKLFAQNLIGKSAGPEEFTLTRKDGSFIAVEVSSHPVKIGEKTLVLGIARDISERKQAEDNLVQTHDTLTRVLEGIDAHVYVADLETFEILYMNKRMIEDFGGDFTGQICYEVFWGKKKKCANCTNTQTPEFKSNPGEVHIWEEQNRKTDRWYRNYDRAIIWTDQRLVRMQIAVDITDSKQATRALELSEDRYRSLFEASHNAIMTLAPPNWNFTSGNPALIELFRLEDEGHFLTFKPWQLSPEYQVDGQRSEKKAQGMIQTAVEEGSNFFHWTHQRVDGEEFPATVQLTRVDLEGEYFLQATVRDISEQVRAEKFIKQQMEDLALLNTLNVAANQGKELKEIFSLLSGEMKRIFRSKNTTVKLLSEDGNHLWFDLHNLDQTIRGQLETLLKINLPDRLEIPIGQRSVYQEILSSGKPQILVEKEVITDFISAFLGAALPIESLKKSIHGLIPHIFQLFGIRSVIVVPLMMAGKPVGLIDMAGSRIFSVRDKVRFTAIAEQLSGIIQRVQAEKDRELNIRELELIYKTFVEGSRLDDIDDITQLLAEKIHEVNPDSYVMVSLYDPEVDDIRVRAFAGLGQMTDRVFNILGVKPSNLRVKELENDLDSDLNALYTSGKLERIPDGLYDLTRGTIPRKLCKTAERLLGVGEVYIAGFGLGMSSTGGLVIFVKQGSQINYPAAIETIVNHFAVIFERRRVQSEILERKAHLEALREVELSITSQLNLDELLYSIAEKASLIVNAAASGFYLLNPDKDILEYIAYTGFDKLPENTDLRIGEGLSGKVWEKQETIIVDNYTEWEGRSQDWVSMGNYYLAGIPVCWGEELLGVLEVALDPSEALSKSDIEMLELFAAQAAIAIQNAHLFREENQRRQESETLREVGMLINRMMDRTELLDLTLVALQKVVPYDSASVQLVKGADLVIEAFRGTDFPERVIGTTYTIKENKLAHPILNEGKKVILKNRDDVEGWLEGPATEKVKSWLGVPLEVKGNRIGILTLDHYSPDQYTELDAELVRAFANQAAIAIENNRLFEDIQRHTREMEVVYESALNMTQELHPEALFEYLHQQAETLFAPDAFMLATLDPTTEMIQISFASEAGIRQTQVEGLQISPDEKNSLLSWIIRKKTPLLIGNVETDSLPVQPLQEGESIHSWLGVPLLVGDRLVGALVVQSYQVEAYNHEHRRLLQLLCNQAAVALENSRLFEEAQRRLSRISSLREIDLAISGSVDIQITMEVIISQLIGTLGVDAACVLLYKPHTQTLEYVSASGFQTESLKHTSLKLGEGLAGKAALERTLVHIPDLTAQSTSLQKSPHFSQEGFTTYLANPLIAKGELVGVLEVFNRSQLEPDLEWLNFLDALARLAAIAIDRLNLFNDLERSNVELVGAYDATIEGWARAIELRDGDTEGHSRRVVKLSLNLAQKMGVTGEALIHIRRGALLHDIGKMAIPDGILLKAGKLSDEEWVIMKKHPVYAYEMLSSIQYLKPALDIPYCHHEWWDGSGYPRELSKENIPLAARIFAVVDVWDALQSDRPYREAWSKAEAADYIKKLSGSQFDPRVIKAFFELIDES